MIEPDRDLFLPPFRMDGRGESVTLSLLVEMPEAATIALALSFPREMASDSFTSGVG